MVITIVRSMSYELLCLVLLLLCDKSAGDYCNYECPPPCQPEVMQEDLSIALVDWTHLWHGMDDDCVEDITVVANGE